MNTLAALVYFVLSLFGIDAGSHVYTDHVRVDGIDALYSKVVARPTATRFECVRSASGQCYYTVFARDCAPSPATASVASNRVQDCRSRPVERFVLARGGSRRIPALPGFRLCVSAEAGVTGPDCVSAQGTASR